MFVIAGATGHVGSTAAKELLGSPATAEGMADLLWAVVMLPEFQLIR